MTDEYFDQISKIIDAAWPEQDEAAERAAAFGRMFDEAYKISRAAWEMYGIDPDDPLLREPYVRNDGSSRIGPNGEVYGGGLPADKYSTIERLEAQGWSAADMPNLPGMWGMSALESYLRTNPVPGVRAFPEGGGGSSVTNTLLEAMDKASYEKLAGVYGKSVAQAVVYGPPDNLLLYAGLGLLAAFLVALPFMLWIGG